MIKVTYTIKGQLADAPVVLDAANLAILKTVKGIEIVKTAPYRPLGRR